MGGGSGDRTSLDGARNKGVVEVSHSNYSLQQQQHQLPPGPVVQWEKILPVRTLKVLLVESDDSTRQVVTALLRNCSYEVTAAANALQAWKILESPTNHIDLVLTEVAMPGGHGGFSGIGLLSKITSNDACKNVPVIMMSSNDSMGTVFKCLSRGAVDFLVKPIRKNELKNLWQHVWRRSHSSSGSVSESGIRTQNSSKLKSADGSDNNTSSNNGDDDDNASIGMNARDGSDNGSGTQSSWRQHAVEVDSPEQMSASDTLADVHDSTCARVVSDSEIFCSKWVSMTDNREYQEKKKHLDVLMGKDLEVGVPRNSDVHTKSHPTEKMCSNLTDKRMGKLHESEKKNEDVLGVESRNAFDEPSTKATDPIGGITYNTDAELVNGMTDCPNIFSRISESIDKINDVSEELPSIQLSLKRLRSTGESENATHDERNILRRSEQSAFSRYRTSANSTKAPTGYVGSCSPIDNSYEAVKTESTPNISILNPAIGKQGSNESSDNNDKGSTTKPATYKEKPAPTLAGRSIHAAEFHPLQAQTCSQRTLQEMNESMEATVVAGKSMGIQCQYQVQHHHHHYHHHHHHVHSRQKQKQQLLQPSEYDDLPSKNMNEATQHCGLSNEFAGPTEENVANYSVHGSNSGSNHVCDGQNGSSAAVNTGANVETADGISEKCGVGSGSGSGTRVEQNRLAQREVALNKFRLKRKGRNFGKKVRYQNRKKLAEQRPRVRGQFVRQPVQEPKTQEQDS